MDIPTLFITFILSAMVIAITLSNWRYGLLAIIPIGLLQDVLRKLTPGVPSLYIVWSALLFAVVVLVVMSTCSLDKRLLWFNDQGLKNAFSLFFFLVLLQAINGLVRWGQPAVPVLGLLFYLGPVAALLTMIIYGRHPIWIHRFIMTYLWVMVPACLTVYLSLWFQSSIPVLREIGEFVGQRLVIYDVGKVLYSYAGLFRVGEIAAFHAATSAAFLIMLIMKKKQALPAQIGMAVLVALLIGAILLTGRRKMLMALSIFLVVQFFLSGFMRRGVSRAVVSFLVLGLTVSMAIGFLGTGQSSPYLQRGKTVFSSVEERVITAVDLLTWAVKRSDGIGLGAGVASQGARYAGVDNFKEVGGASESGIGYLAIELGLPGIAIVSWLIYYLLRTLWSKLRFVARLNDDLFLYASSFVSLLVANLATFSVATQLYGDFFVLIILGMIAGMLYATIYHAAILQKKQYQKKIGNAPSSIFRGKHAHC